MKSGALLLNLNTNISFVTMSAHYLFNWGKGEMLFRILHQSNLAFLTPTIRVDYQFTIPFLQELLKWLTYTFCHSSLFLTLKMTNDSEIALASKKTFHYGNS